MTIHIKTFAELTPQELYDLLQLRSEVFVVEQNCPYQDVDGLDQESVHLWIEDCGRVAACARVYRIEGGFIKIGRVVTPLQHRGKGYGRAIMEESIKVARERFGGAPILIHAQAYATGFYEKFGFRISSEVFLEDGIEHYEMQLHFS